MMVPSTAVGLLGAGTMGAANVAYSLLSQTPPESTQSYFFQLGAVGLAIGVGFWLIRRYDERADRAAATAQQLLAEEHAAHEVTRKQLLECLQRHTHNDR